MTADQKYIRISPSVHIESSAVEYEFIKSSGPGGQNVNKVSTGVRLRFDLQACTTLDMGIKSRLYRIAAGRISSDGILMLESQVYRTQLANKKDVTDKLIDLISKASQKPKKRIKTNRTKASVEKRLELKSRRSTLKQSRKKPQW